VFVRVSFKPLSREMTMCNLVPTLEYWDDDYGPEYSDEIYFCEECGEYVEEPCEDKKDEAG
jgi:hypothetical protein